MGDGDKRERGGADEEQAGEHAEPADDRWRAEERHEWQHEAARHEDAARKVEVEDEVGEVEDAVAALTEVRCMRARS